MNSFFLLFLVVALGGIALLIYLLPVAALIGFGRFMLKSFRRIQANQNNRPTLARLADELDLEVQQSSLFFGDRLSGTFAGFEITIDTPASSPSGTRWSRPGSVRIRLTTANELPHRLALFSRDAPLADRLPAGKPIRSFDSAFDHDFIAYGRGVDVAARLDANVRRRLIELDARGDVLAQDDSIVVVTRRAPTPSLLVHILHRAAALGRDLTGDGPGAPDRLLANAMSDTNIAVRYQNLDLLLRSFPASEQAAQGLRLAWDAPERGIRYLAAIRKGVETHPFLEETALMTSEPENLRVMVLRHLARHGSRESVVALLHRALRDPAPPVGRTAVELLGRLQDRSAVPLLIAFVERAQEDDQARIAVAQALGNIGDPAAESCLLVLLAEDLLAVKVAAATALAKAGTSASLPTLARVAQRYLGLPELAAAARSAIARIETRNGPADRGQLSLVEGRVLDGALSLPLANGGELSLPRGGALSLPERKQA